MAYTSNPYAAKARKLATNMVKRGYSKAMVARMYGVHRATIGKWMKQATKHSGEKIYTKSSRPHTHPQQIPPSTVNRLIELRKMFGRCAPVIHAHLVAEGYTISLSSVGRILKRYGLVRRKKQATLYKAIHPRPLVTMPGDLIQMDTIHFIRPNGSRFYIYAIIDLYSRLAYAEYQPKLRQTNSFAIIERAQQVLGFSFHMVQTDHGPEFKDGLAFALGHTSIKLRHSRIRTPNDNAHIERFNRTLQEECFGGKPPNEATIHQDLLTYLQYYNYDRKHLSLQLQTPAQFVAKVMN